MRIILVSLVLALCGCETITQDDFSIARMESASVSDNEMGVLSTILMFQDEGMQTITSAEDISRILAYTLRAYHEHFGHVPSMPRDLVVMELRENSSQWLFICDDSPNDSLHVDGCSDYSGRLFPHSIADISADWEIALPSRIYQRGPIVSAGVFVHEMIHGLLAMDGHDDYDHVTPGVWEHDAGSVYHRVLDMMIEDGWQG